jgi:eukaryotic-like serine/threonine-protein kinase
VFKFITNRPFWVNLVVAIVIALLFLFLVLKMLGWITKHGEYLEIPAITGMKTDEAIKLLEKQGFDVYIQDSIFTDTAARGIVLKQLPDPGATVKINRTVFITVNRYIPPMVDMPRLEGMNLTFALKLLERNHLKLGDTVFEPNIMLNAVIKQLYNGEPIPEKAKIQWGSKIDLVVGGGLGTQQIPVPYLYGLTFCDAKAQLEANGIVIGAIIADPDGPKITDTCSAFVYQQRPERFDAEKRPMFIQSGQLVDLWISQVKKTPADTVNIK